MVKTCELFLFSAAFAYADYWLVCIIRVSHGTHETQINHVIKLMSELYRNRTLNLNSFERQLYAIIKKLI